MPDLSDALRELFEEEARSFTTPTRGLNVLTAQARGARRRAVARSAGLSAVGVAAVGGLVFGSIQVFGVPGRLAPGASASAPPVDGVAWDPWGAVDEAMAGFTMPQCGDEFAPEAVAVGPIRATPEGELQIEEDGTPSMLIVWDRFTHEDGTPTHLLAVPSSVILTQDGVVVAISERPAESLEVFRTDFESQSAALFWGGSTCAAQAAWEAEHGDIMDSYDDLDDAARAELDEVRTEFFADWEFVPSGDFIAYTVTPIVFGPQLAVAREITGMGIPRVNAVYSDIANTPFVDDPRIAPYCNDANAEPPGTYFSCNPPRDVLQEVLTFEIDDSKIVEIPSGVAISEPLYLTVP